MNKNEAKNEITLHFSDIISVDCRPIEVTLENDDFFTELHLFLARKIIEKFGIPSMDIGYFSPHYSEEQLHELRRDLYGN